MPAQLLLAPAARGKTHYAIQRIREIIAAEPLAPVTVILPNQRRVAEFRRRLAEAGGALGVELHTFHTLYAEILTRAGQPRPRLLDPLQVRLLRAIVDQLHQEGRLQHYAPLRTKPGFIAALRAAIEELKRARIEPDDFSSAVSGMGDNLTEIAAIYTAYQEWLLQENWADPEGQGWLAALALDADPQLESGLRLVVVNGFDEFNPTQLGVLALLTQRAAQTLVTLTGEASTEAQPKSRLAHRRFHRAQSALRAALDPSPARLPPCPPVPLAPLEAYLFESASQRVSASPIHHSSFTIPHFVEAQTRAAEARAALRWIKTLIVQEGFELSDAAILARDLTPYRPFIEEVGAEFGVPLRIPGGLPLAENPAVAALLSLLSIPALDWPRRPVLAAWRSPYFNWEAEGITAGDAATLDTITRLGRVISGLGQWEQAFAMYAGRKPPNADFTDEEALPLPHLTGEGPGPALSHAEGVGVKFDSFAARITPPPRAPLREYAVFIEDLLGDDPALATRFTDPEGDVSLRVVACARENLATTERDIAALRAFKDVLRGLVLAESVLGTQPLDYAGFFAELRGAVEAATYTAQPEAGVLAASVLDARGLSFRAAAILGLSEGEFPQIEREDPFLSEADRAALREGGLPTESKLRGDEPSFFYQAVTRAGECLLLCRPYLADDGQPWEASPYWLHLWRLSGEPQIQRVRPQDHLPWEQAASPVEYEHARAESDPHIQRGIAILQSRLNEQVSSPHNGQIPELAPLLLTRYSPAFGWSASKLESYGTCPFYFYIAYALDLEPRTPPEEGYDVRMLGSMLHQILEFTYGRAENPGDVNECLALMPQIAAEVFAAAPAEYGFRPTPLWEIQQKDLLTKLERTIRALAEVSGGYTPRHFEPRFGMGQPSLMLQTEIGDVRLHGYIDRVDAGADGRLRIIDYKAGGTAISARHLEEGRRLQLPIYALAAREALGLGEIAGGFYWHIQKAEASSLKLEKYPGGVQAAFETAEQHVASHVKKIREGQFTPQAPKGGCPHYCPAVEFCWQYEKGY